MLSSYLKLFLRTAYPSTRVSFNFCSLHDGAVPYVSTIGLEIHAQLTGARTKLFSDAPYSFSAAPNTQIAPFDAAIPGSMPLLNRACVEAAVLAGLALNCHVNTTSRFERKHYFYADAPAGYQITQNHSPIAQNGWLDFLWSDGSPNSVQVSRASIRRIQLEQDTGKSLHDERNGRSLIDLNRAGVGLIEVVTNPTFTCAAQTVAFVEELASLLAFLGVCSANMSTGELRVDVNVSVGPDLHSQGPVVEIKNVSGFRAIKNAVDYEIKRQTDILRRGGKVINETRFYDRIKNKTIPMRDKEVVQDYRFLPEPDLPSLRLVASCENCQKLEVLSTHEDCSTLKGITDQEPRLWQPDHTRLPCIQCLAIRHRLKPSPWTIRLPGEIRRHLVFHDRLPLERAAVLVSNPSLHRLYETSVDLVKVDQPATGLLRGLDANSVLCKVRQETAYWCTGLLYSRFKHSSDSRLPSPSQLASFVLLNLRGQLYGEDAEKVLDSICSRGCSACPKTIAEELGVLLVCDYAVIASVCDLFVRENTTLMEKYARKPRKRTLQAVVRKLLGTSTYNASKFHPLLAERAILESYNRIVPSSKAVPMASDLAER
ncbi:hypothetical protein AAHC03_026307 [Spirometra sp. Aus1]